MEQELDYSLVAFGDTEKKEFPLILVFGRENNGEGRVIPGVSIYDEKVSVRSSFWNRALTFLQRCAGSNLHLRNECIKRYAGPILFTNAFPRQIPNSVIDKDGIRASIDPLVIQEHLSSIFEMNIVQRVKIVIFSTGHREPFNAARDWVKEHCINNGLAFVEVPYFGNRRVTNSEIDESITEFDKDMIKTIVDNFYQCT